MRSVGGVLQAAAQAAAAESELTVPNQQTQSHAPWNSRQQAVHKRADGWTDGWTDRWIDGCMRGRGA
eukprot:359116-Chlamydomonas_euryale.AAC.14